MYAIEKNVLMPAKYPFGEMAVGDFFVVNVSREKIYSAVSYFGARDNKKFTIRRQADGMYRVWRTA